MPAQEIVHCKLLLARRSKQTDKSLVSSFLHNRMLVGNAHAWITRMMIQAFSNALIVISYAHDFDYGPMEVTLRAWVFVTGLAVVVHLAGCNLGSADFCE